MEAYLPDWNEPYERFVIFCHFHRVLPVVEIFFFENLILRAKNVWMIFKMSVVNGGGRGPSCK